MKLGVNDLTDTHPLTVYYLAETETSEYYVPVTKRIDNSETNDITAAVEQLADGPGKASGLLTDFNNDVKLLSKPKVKDYQVTLDFNSSIYGSADENKNGIIGRTGQHRSHVNRTAVDQKCFYKSKWKIRTGE